MYIHSVYYLTRFPRDRRRSAAFYIIYGAIMLFLSAVAYFVNGVMGQMMWIEHRDEPGGPTAYFVEHIADWYNIFGTAALSCANILGDGLLVSRNAS